MKGRSSEVRELLRLTPDQLKERAAGRLTICDDLDTLHARFAEDIAEELRAGIAAGKRTRLILPVGPTGQYPILAETIKREGLSLANTHIFFMDEYCDGKGEALPAGHPLSFKGEMERDFFSRLPPDSKPSDENIVFPDHLNVHRLENMIEELGGIDTCYAGVGIHGHLAFNEPGPGVRESGPGLVTLNDYTVTLNAIRSGVGGDLENFPRQAVTLGMRQILGAGRIRLYCRSDIPGIDWANTVVRLAILGQPGDDYPVTHIRGTDYHVTATREALRVPEVVL